MNVLRWWRSCMNELNKWFWPNFNSLVLDSCVLCIVRRHKWQLQHRCEFTKPNGLGQYVQFRDILSYKIYVLFSWLLFNSCVSDGFHALQAGSSSQGRIRPHKLQENSCQECPQWPNYIWNTVWIHGLWSLVLQEGYEGLPEGGK